MSKYGWPEQIEELLPLEKDRLPKYDDHTADRLVAHAFKYMQQKLSKRRRTKGRIDVSWLSHSYKAQPKSNARVVGIDAHQKGKPSPAWLFMPLLETNEHGESVLVKHIWRNGEVTESVDLLRFEFYGGDVQSTFSFLPTAIVRPVRRNPDGSKVGHKLFESVYEFPTSFRQYQIHQNLEETKRVIAQKQDIWLALLDENQREVLKERWAALEHDQLLLPRAHLDHRPNKKQEFHQGQGEHHQGQEEPHQGQKEPHQSQEEHHGEQEEHREEHEEHGMQEDVETPTAQNEGRLALAEMQRRISYVAHPDFATVRAAPPTPYNPYTGQIGRARFRAAPTNTLHNEQTSSFYGTYRPEQQHPQSFDHTDYPQYAVQNRFTPYPYQQLPAEQYFPQPGGSSHYYYPPRAASSSAQHGTIPSVNHEEEPDTTLRLGF